MLLIARELLTEEDENEDERDREDVKEEDGNGGFLAEEEEDRSLEAPVDNDLFREETGFSDLSIDRLPVELEGCVYSEAIEADNIPCLSKNESIISSQLIMFS